MKAPSSAPVASLKSRSARRFLRQAVFPLVALACCAGTSHAAGVLGTYYLTEYFPSGTVAIDAIHGTSFVQNPSVADGLDLPIAVVGGYVRTTGFFTGEFGGEYGGVPGLTLVPTGPVYTNLFGGNTGDLFLDGTSNGINNFTIGYNSGNVIATDLNWGGSGSILFNVGGGGRVGITYDRSNDSLWIQNSDGGGITNYAMDGTVLSFFPTATGRKSLAMDIDHTLWSALYFEGVGYLEHRSTDGGYLGSLAVDGLGTTWGGEIAAIPEPSNFFGAVPLVAFGLFLRHRDRLRKQPR